MKRKNLEDIKPILTDITKSLEKIYKDGLKAVILYGSYARGDAIEESDIDIIVLLENVEDPVTEIDRCSESLWQIELKYDTLISIIPFKESYSKVRRLPVILNAKKEGIFI
ncbi:MAG: nucleotidyltransferase domain-containing protein [Nitrospiraceae bacterium]|nr:nucleotidyltransferase domain-containing protein [Nitrospiraceae bacterium]